VGIKSGFCSISGESQFCNRFPGIMVRYRVAEQGKAYVMMCKYNLAAIKTSLAKKEIMVHSISLRSCISVNWYVAVVSGCLVASSLHTPG